MCFLNSHNFEFRVFLIRVVFASHSRILYHLSQKQVFGTVLVASQISDLLTEFFNDSLRSAKIRDIDSSENNHRVYHFSKILYTLSLSLQLNDPVNINL